jgi:hypothetical protein
VALEPFRRKIGIPGAAPLIPVRTIAMPDIGGQIAAAGQSIFAAGEPERQQKAIEAGEIAAARTEVRQPDGTLISQAPDVKGGIIYQQAYNKLVREKYLTEFNFDLQQKLDAFSAENFNDPNKLREVGLAHIEGALSTVPEEFRAQATEIAFREGQERFRTALSSYTSRQNASLINGTVASIRNGVQLYTKLAADPNADPAEKEKLKDRLTSLTGSLRDLGKSDVEVNSILEDNDFNLGTADEFTLSVENTPTFMDWAAKATSVEDLNLTLNWLDGVNTPGTLNGTVSGGIKKVEATPDYARKKLESLFPKINIAGGGRAPDHPLSIQNPSSYHNTVNGGRAFDVTPIAGMTFDEYVSRVKKAGFNIVEAIDETTPEAMKKYGSTGKNWHIAYGPTINEKSTAQDSAASELDFNKLHEMFPSANVRSNVREAVRMRISDINRAEAEAAAADREARNIAKQQEMINALEDKTRDGVYNYTTKERDTLDVSFGSVVNKSGGLNTEAGRAAAIGFISTYAYMPGDMKGWFTSNLRNPDSWKSALDLYNSTKTLTTQSGSSMGDVLVDSLSAKDEALFNSALRMQSAGVEDAVIGAQIKNIISGVSYTSSEAQVQFNATRGKDAYRQSKGKALKDLFNIDGIPPKDLSLNYDEAFAANLAIYKNDIEEADKATRAQLQSLSVRDPVFFSGIGYKNVYAKIGGSPKAFNQILMNHLGTLTMPNGQPLMQQVMIGDGTTRRPIVGGPNSTIKISPLDGNVNQIGRYQIFIYDPANRNKLLNRIVVDFSKDLNPQIQAYTRKQRAAIDASDKAGIEAARQQQVEDRKTFEKAKRQSQTVSGPKL